MRQGHKGDTLRQAAEPDRIVRHEASHCRHCQALLPAGTARGVEARQVFDLIERPLIVTEHRASIYRCGRCRAVTKAAFPEGVVSSTQYGERIKAAAIYLNVQQLIPEDRAAEALSDLFGAPFLLPGEPHGVGSPEGARPGAGPCGNRRPLGGSEGPPSR